jgi:predicted ATPase
MPKLTVKDFLSIKHAEIEIKPLTVIIGPQAQGKSLITKLVYYFNLFFKDMRDALIEEIEFEEFYHKFTGKFSELFPRETWEKVKPFWGIRVSCGSGSSLRSA